ncbi:tetratricopeptide repeat protein [Desulfobacterales bacterium HSG2]|nr:tetratricopeptide repeat protein [Desulfobacterales bacterium HSG2]
MVDYVQIPIIDEENADIGLGGLDEDAVAELFQKIGVKATVAQLKSVAHKYACHPLALNIFGQMIKKKYDGYLIKPIKVTALDQRRELFKLLDEARHSLPGREKAEYFLKVVSHCIEDPSLDIIATGITGQTKYDDNNMDSLLELVLTLSDWFLLYWDGGKKIVILHPLLKSYFASLTTFKESILIHQRLLNYYCNKPILKNASTLDEMNSLLLAIRHAIYAKDLNKAANLMFSTLYTETSVFDWFGVWGHQLTGIELLKEFTEIAGNDSRGNILLALAELYRQLNRPQLAIEQIEQAIAIFESAENGNPQEVLASLARAYASRGVIYTETDRASLSINEFDRAISLFDRIKDIFVNKTFDLADAFTNRGNALRDLGRLKEAVEDYNRSYDMWQQFVDEFPKVVKLNMALIEINRGLAYIEMGFAEKAINDFENAILIYRGYQSSRNDDLNWRLAYAQTMLARAFLEIKQTDKAFDFIKQALDTLQFLTYYGRKDIEQYFALALMYYAKIFIANNKFNESLSYCERSVSIFEKLVRKSGTHFDGLLAHARCVRAQIRYQIGDMQGSKEDRSQAFTAMRQIIRNRGFESDIRNVFIDNALLTVEYLIHNNKDESMLLLSEILDICEKGLVNDVNIEFSTSLKNKVINIIPHIESIAGMHQIEVSLSRRIQALINNTNI